MPDTDHFVPLRHLGIDLQVNRLKELLLNRQHDDDAAFDGGTEHCESQLIIIRYYPRSC